MGLMATEQQENFQLIEISEIKDWSWDDLLKFAVLKSISASAVDLEKYSIMVDMIEAIASDETEKSNTYETNLQKKIAELDTTYGKREENQAKKLKELTTFKFRELLKLIRKKIPKEETGVLK
jgi:hypothetical protein